jgi:hypothetical protein
VSWCPVVPVHTSAPVGREADVRRKGASLGCRPGPVVWLSSIVALSDTREKGPAGGPGDAAFYATGSGYAVLEAGFMR